MQRKFLTVSTSPHYRILLIVLLIVSATAIERVAAQNSALHYVSGSTRRLSQLTGDFDRALQSPTLNRTGQRFSLYATDLGSSFEHKGKLFFLFGDSWGQPRDLDAVAWSQSRDPAQLTLDFYSDINGEWLPPIVPGVGNGAFEIPSGGISLNGQIYVVFTVDWPQPGNIMGRSVLAVSGDDGRSFRALYPLSQQHFINVSLWRDGDWVYLFGSGEYRKSSVSLARTRVSNIGDKNKWQYWNGENRWSAQENAAQALFQHDVVGEFSVAFVPQVQRWLMLYNSSEPRGIVMRSARTAHGPWSEGQVIFDPWRDGGYGKFMHVSSQFKERPSDNLSDAGREGEWGGEYGPYLMARFTQPLRATSANKTRGCRIFYTMSAWNPYQVMVMQSDLRF